ncbi:MAG: gamma-glutamyl-gamma-aminobutyrate hydrolase family protein [Clostridia bacterium]|nr:gamma-glutamyl-gamma-aminobutyrate hydrolase family protein [Clostridia bacterium]MBQ3477742.1 gamma-glutamyl-gamma-aminobutyrate hydrolase family protein [Clostridia bacterium]MBQ9040539.1 gamma-glutamyl-gamma-aminobutyrate hydrolase family protein [Clostridia bacterium]
MKPLIGLIPLVDAGRDSLWMLPGYMEGVASAGGLPVMLPLTDDEADLNRLCGLCDGFLLTGGQDVSPALYGQASIPECGETCPRRDAMEAGVLRRAMALDKPVLGICRGIQFINAALGGTLWQDLPSQHPSGTCHRQSVPYDAPSHDVAVLPDTPLAALLKRDALGVNSYHHQAVRELAPGLQPMALSPDGLVEALWHPDQRFLWAVQWHPEFAWKVSPEARAIFRAFVEAC